MRKILILLFVAFISCDSETSEFEYFDLSKIPTVNLENPETLFEFDDKLPGDLVVKDSLAFMIQVHSDTFFTVLNTKTKRIISQFGTKGNGPSDLISPIFAQNLNSPEIILYEVNKILKINISNSNKFSIEKYMNYPEKLSTLRLLNFSNNFIVGRDFRKRDKFLFIYNQKTDSIIDIENVPKTNLDLEPMTIMSLYSHCLGLNEEKNRVIAGMVFFDMLHVFDLNGKKIKTCCFTENYTPQFKYDFFKECPAGFKNIFYTKDYCYLMRRVKNDDGTFSRMLIKVNWEGKPETVYKISDDLENLYYIDENQKKMYIIRHYVKKEIEIYAIVAYNIGY